MTIDPLGPLRQALYATTLADLETLVSAKDVVRGAIAIAADQNYAPYVALPSAASFPGSVAAVGLKWAPLASVLSVTPTTRVIHGTAPITINGTDHADLSSDCTIAVANATTGTVGVVQLDGDLGGIASSPSVLKIRGTSMQTAGGSLAAGKVLATTGASSCDFVAPSSLDIIIGAGNTNVLAKFNGLHGLQNSSITDDGSIVDFANGVANLHDASLAGSPASGVELLQAYAGQIVARMQSGFLDYVLSPANIAESSTKAPKIGQQTSQYTLTAPGTSSFTISPAIMGQLMQANRSMYGLLLCTQRVEETATTGWAGIYLIEAHTDGSGNILAPAVNIVLIGTCGGAGPAVTVSATGAANFTLSIANVFAGTLTGMWHLLYGHCGS